MNTPRAGKPRRWPQFSLTWLVATVLVLGPALGIGGPIAIRVFQELRTPRPAPPPRIPPTAFDKQPVEYYESAETPLN